MVEIKYTSIMDVTTSWEKLRQMENYEEKAGELIFMQIFTLEPRARSLFNFTDEEDIKANPRFLGHAKQIVSMVSSAIELLGPDLEPLMADLIALGERHIGYGVKPEYFPTMSKSLQYCMKELLGEKFSADQKQSWNEVLDFMIEQMSIGAGKEKKVDASDEVVFDTKTDHKADNISYNDVMDVEMTWSKVKETKNYMSVAGEAIFLKIFEIEPRARALFNFGENEIIRSNPLFQKHADTMVDMIDCATAMLGPDLDPLEEDLIELGRRHVAYGVAPEYLPTMGKSLFFTLEKILGSRFTKQDKESWQKVFQFMISKMVIGIEAEQADKRFQ